VFEEYPDAAGFLAAIRAAPEDATPRLVFSDWLEERGDPRAAWLREPDLWPWMAPDLHDPLPALLAELLVKEGLRRGSADSLLRRLGPLAGDAVRRWIREGDDRYDLGRSVVRAVPPTTLRPVADLVSIWQTSEVEAERNLAVIDLGHHGPAAATVVGELIGFLEGIYQEEDDSDGTDICWTLARIGQPAAEAIPILIELARAGLFESRESVKSLGRLVPRCSESFRDRPEWIDDLRDLLLEQLDCPDEVAIVSRILQRGPRVSEWILDDLIEALLEPTDGDRHEIRDKIARALLAIGEPARKAVPTLRKVLEDYDLFVPTGGFAEAAREAIRTALATLDPG
jgi:uncharacterized protein (TIGR02996 family)